jgi:hypothetical protein
MAWNRSRRCDAVKYRRFAGGAWPAWLNACISELTGLAARTASMSMLIWPVASSSR